MTYWIRLIEYFIRILQWRISVNVVLNILKVFNWIHRVCALICSNFVAMLMPFNLTWVKPSEFTLPIMFNIATTIRLIAMCAVLGYAFGRTNDSVYKRKMCIKYEVKGHTSTSAVLVHQFCSSKKQCMAGCVRHASCNTLHFRSIDATCELLETSDMCLSLNVSKHTTLVKLDECKKRIPWNVITPTLTKLQWMEPHDVGYRDVLSVIGGFRRKRQFARVFHEGIYLPGFVYKNKFLASTMEDKLILCRESFQVLTSVHPDDYMYMNLTLGGEVPPSAVVGGYWRDGTPLYVALIFEQGNAAKPGFYNAANEMIYVYSKRPNHHRWPFQLLLEN